jgi:hypothetical protein
MQDTTRLLLAHPHPVSYRKLTHTELHARVFTVPCKVGRHNCACNRELTYP